MVTAITIPSDQAEQPRMRLSPASFSACAASALCCDLCSRVLSRSVAAVSRDIAVSGLATNESEPSAAGIVGAPAGRCGSLVPNSLAKQADGLGCEKATGLRPG